MYYLAYYSGHRERPLPVGRDQPVDMRDGHVSKTHSLSSRHSNKGHHSDHYARKDAYPYTHGAFGSHLAVPVDYNVHVAVPVSSAHGRRVLGQIQPEEHLQPKAARKSGHPGNRDIVDIQRFSSVRDPQVRQSLQQTYHRLKERQRKLNALRFGLNQYELDFSDVASMQSEVTDYGDRKSMMSGTSYTQGQNSVLFIVTFMRCPYT